MPPNSSRRLAFPKIIDPEAPPVRPERHVANSIATMRRHLIVALATTLAGSVALAMKGTLLDGFVRSDGKDGVGHRRCSRKDSGESTALTRLGPPLNATDPP